MQLTKKEMKAMVEANLIHTLDEEQKKQVMYFYFGGKFMKSPNKGSKIEYVNK
jgi:hypothetical protein